MIPSVYPIVGLLALLVVLAAIKLAPCLKAFRRGWFVVAAAVAILYAGDKPASWTFAFNLGLHDAGSSYDQTEGTLYARWTYDESVAGYAFRWAYSVNDGEYVQLPDAMVSDGSAVASIDAGPDDTVRVQCYPKYVPPIHVVTNGVYHMDGVMRSMDTTNSPAPKFVTPGITIYADLSDGSRQLLAPVTNSPPVPSSVITVQQPQNEGE